jgi:formylglycine-generating enzyme required for sulfatase activity
MVEIQTDGGWRYCIDSTEVTNAAYQAFLDTNPDPSGVADCFPNAWPPSIWPYAPGHDDDPVTAVNYCQARGFCAYAGKRLCGAIGGGITTDLKPENDEWLYACTRGGARQYPYGNDIMMGLCNIQGSAVAAVAGYPTCEGGFAGLFDMEGNASEWTAGCDVNDGCFVLGGDYYLGASNGCSSALSTSKIFAAQFTSFRCCRDD